MFLHLGGEIIIPKKDIIAIMDINTLSLSEINKEFLKVTEEEGFSEYVTEKGKEKSVIITNNRVYFSKISSTTLKKRSENFIDSINNWDD